MITSWYSFLEHILLDRGERSYMYATVEGTLSYATVESTLFVMTLLACRHYHTMLHFNLPCQLVA